MVSFQRQWMGLLHLLPVVCIAVAVTLSEAGQSRPSGPRNAPGRPSRSSELPEDEPTIERTHKQKQEFLKHKLEDLRKDAAEMADLTRSLQEDLEKTTEHELPFKVVERAEKVEKLAKKIKNAAKGY